MKKNKIATMKEKTKSALAGFHEDPLYCSNLSFGFFFQEGEKNRTPTLKPSEQGRKPTSNSSHMSLGWDQTWVTYCFCIAPI